MGRTVTVEKAGLFRAKRRTMSGRITVPVPLEVGSVRLRERRVGIVSVEPLPRGEEDVGVVSPVSFVEPGQTIEGSGPVGSRWTCRLWPHRCWKP